FWCGVCRRFWRVFCVWLFWFCCFGRGCCWCFCGCWAFVFWLWLGVCVVWCLVFGGVVLLVVGGGGALVLRVVEVLVLVCRLLVVVWAWGLG
ncbi:hypothetical protein RA272_28660, partial [Pseudomonas syringae pv. tagetis]|uniref:hypothetical protein n=1 Tax=Pseudomonas syringae group genomosp. 7 TaxID=251699 RepID=UPI0037705F08